MNTPDRPPLKNNATNPSAKSMAVSSLSFPPHNMRNQQTISRTEGTPSEEASIEKTRGVYGFSPLANICSPQMQNPQSPMAQRLKTAARSLQNFLRE